MAMLKFYTGSIKFKKIQHISSKTFQFCLKMSKKGNSIKFYKKTDQEI